MIANRLTSFNFTTVLDAFGGTGAVSYALKWAGKQVTYNDMLAFNTEIGRALIENDSVRLNESKLDEIGARRRGRKYSTFIERTFNGIYFTDEENRWLDTAVGNIRAMECRYERSLAWFALFQSCLAKRPYNLFHRKNLYMRTAEVSRSFGNKATWDRSFDAHFRAFAVEANRAIIDSGGKCRAICADALAVQGEFDLVYIDPPYMNGAGRSVNYREFYHFLEGMVQYEKWPRLVDVSSPHRRLFPRDDPWSDPGRVEEIFRCLFGRFRGSIIAVSYRSNGIPPIRRIASLLAEFRPRVSVFKLKPYQYALSSDRKNNETLIIGFQEQSSIRHIHCSQ